MVNDIIVVHSDTNLLIKFADDITLSIPIEPNLPDDSSVNEFQNIDPPPPGTIPIIEKKRVLQLLEITFHKNPCN